MKKYLYKGKEVHKPTSISINGFTYVNPSDMILKMAGYKIKID